jgi:hypothetical protein
LTARVIGSLGMPPSPVEGYGFGAAAPRARDVLTKVQYSRVCSHKVTYTLFRSEEHNEITPRGCVSVAFARVVRRTSVLDGRNALDRDAWEAAGWSYRPLGRRAG